MNVVKCKNGHFYDADKFETCPHCGDAHIKDDYVESKKEYNNNKETTVGIFNDDFDDSNATKTVNVKESKAESANMGDNTGNQKKEEIPENKSQVERNASLQNAVEKPKRNKKVIIIVAVIVVAVIMIGAIILLLNINKGEIKPKQPSTSNDSESEIAVTENPTKEIETTVSGKTYTINNESELEKAQKEAKPGDKFSVQNVKLESDGSRFYLSYSDVGHSVLSGTIDLSQYKNKIVSVTGEVKGSDMIFWDIDNVVVNENPGKSSDWLTINSLETKDGSFVDFVSCDYSGSYSIDDGDSTNGELYENNPVIYGEFKYISDIPNKNDILFSSHLVLPDGSMYTGRDFISGYEDNKFIASIPKDLSSGDYVFELNLVSGDKESTSRVNFTIK